MISLGNVPSLTRRVIYLPPWASVEGRASSPRSYTGEDRCHRHQCLEPYLNSAVTSLTFLSWWRQVVSQQHQQPFSDWWGASAGMFWRSKCWDLPNLRQLWMGWILRWSLELGKQMSWRYLRILGRVWRLLSPSFRQGTCVLDDHTRKVCSIHIQANTLEFDHEIW